MLGWSKLHADCWFPLEIGKQILSAKGNHGDDDLSRSLDSLKASLAFDSADPRAGECLSRGRGMHEDPGD